MVQVRAWLRDGGRKGGHTAGDQSRGRSEASARGQRGAVAVLAGFRLLILSVTRLPNAVGQQSARLSNALPSLTSLLVPQWSEFPSYLNAALCLARKAPHGDSVP